MPRYADVQPIFERRCVVCHSGRSKEWPLTSYQDVADWSEFVRDEVQRCAMPPPGSGVPITTEERAAILTWIRCGYPR